MPTAPNKDISAGSQNKFVPGNDLENPNRMENVENSANSAVYGSGSYSSQDGAVGNRPGPLTGHGFLSKAERPYAGAWEGRFEDRPDDDLDSFTRKMQQTDEESTLAKRAQRYPNHGNVGWSGNYSIDWKVER